MTRVTNHSLQIPRLSVEEDERVFQTPWEARAFAIVNQLATTEHYSWLEWTDCLANEISATEQASPGSKSYYEQWVNACETLLVAKGLLDSSSIDQKIAELLAEHEAEH